MEAARVLKLRGHEPVIHEQTDHLGGTFIAAASAESYKGKLRDLLTWYRKQMADLGIEIHYNEKSGEHRSVCRCSYNHRYRCSAQSTEKSARS